ncbi:MAG: hypothetical protein ACTSWG_10305 [Candidatus Helarchaeota archaeon]
MLKNKQCIIIGSGSSVRQNMWNVPIKDLELWKKIKNSFTIGINWSFYFFDATIHMFNDAHFYWTEKEFLNQLSLVISFQNPQFGDWKKQRWYEMKKMDNIYLVPIRKKKKDKNNKTIKEYWSKQAWQNGFYDPHLSGQFALNMAIALGFEEIFLLGYDACAINGHTHFYDDNPNIGITNFDGIKKCGIGIKENGECNTSSYNNKNFSRDRFGVFKEELNKIKIWNVCKKSNIDVFPKISYNNFYNKLNSTIDYSKARKYIKTLMKKYYA